MAGIPRNTSAAAAGRRTGSSAFLSEARGSGSQIYTVDERNKLFGHGAEDPAQLTSGPIEWGPPVFSRDGKKIFAAGSTRRAESGAPRPEIQSVSAFSWRHLRRSLVAFSKDGKSVAYVSYPDGILWRANRDGSDRVPLTSPPLRPRGLVARRQPDRVRSVRGRLPSLDRAFPMVAAAKRLLPEDSGQETPLS